MVSLNPGIGICLAEMPIPKAQFSDEFVSVQTKISLRILLYGR
ncbi:hypothetical protein F859_gp25 [Enterobacteria phage mEp390]|nr:hypothetical protein F859_gp25 [Enterobacteria phage mEp390]AFM76121.1 hypothetical protein mEp390_025 [Enterobacteria phage mEp390]